MINLVDIRNFRSFAHLRLSLGRFNVLIGANGTGKSNFVEAFEFLKDAMDSRLSVAVARHENWQGVRCRKMRSRRVSFCVEGTRDVLFTGRKTKRRDNQEYKNPQYRYQLAFEHGPGNEDQITQEAALVAPTNTPLSLDAAFSWFARDREKVKIGGSQEPDRTDLPLTRAHTSDRLFLSAPFFSLAAIVVGEEINGWQRYDLDPGRARQAHLAEDVTKLSETGDNLSLLLRQLDRSDSTDLRERILAIMRALVPGFENWGTEPLADGRISYKIKEYPVRSKFPPALISDGTIRLLSLLSALLVRPYESSTIFIEEPERNLHPLVMQQVVELMRSVAQDTQLIVTTHSPDFVRYCRPEEVFLVDKHEGATQILPTKSLENMDRFLQTFSLADLWTMGYLEHGIP